MPCTKSENEPVTQWQFKKNRFINVKNNKASIVFKLAKRTIEFLANSLQ